MKKTFFLLPLSLFIIFSPVLGKTSNPREPQVKAFYTIDSPLPQKKVNSPELSVTAEGVFVMDLHSGAVLFDKNPHKRLKPASLTKIMTSLVVMDYYKEDSILKVVNGQKSVGSSINLVKGDLFLAQDLLNGLLISSGNDAAITFAENYPGGYSSFVSKMNQKVNNLGLENTHFSNVSGVEGADHYTSAFDISMIAKEGLDRPIFENIVSIKSVKIKSLKGNLYPLESTNVLLGKPGFYGVKTGWTPEAGECLVILAERDAHPILISILNSKDRFGEGEKIANWVYSNYVWE